MVNFKLNGQNVSALGTISLLDYLREDARMISVKNGCGGGACGACMVIIDGKAVRACVQKIEKIENKEVTTVEGLSEREKKVYGDAFAEAGAVQCGFCIPGMVISAKALLDVNHDPTPEDVKKAIRNNICRCTGYVKIEEAILMAAKALREDKEVEKRISTNKLGQNVHRVDAVAKTLGYAEYCADVFMDNMLYASVLRTPAPRAKILNIDTSKAAALEGVAAVMTAADIPGNVYQGYIFKDWPVMVPIGEESRYIGDAIAIVAAETKGIADEALKLIEVTFEELEPLVCPKEALREGAIKIHDKGNLLSRTYVKKGDPDEMLAKSKYVVKGTFKTPINEHAFMEPESCIVFYEGDILTAYVATQDVHHTAHDVAHILDLPFEKVRCISKFIGGGFGGKEDLSVEHHAALLCQRTKRPVKLTFTRQESLMVHPKRHPFETTVEMGCDENGHLTALKAYVIADTGAYASLGTAVLERACTHVCGPYKIPSIELEGLCVYTNNPPGGAFRGFGVPQTTFASESLLTLLGEKAGLDPWEMRYRNAVEPGDYLPPGQLCEGDVAIKETLEAVKDQFYSNKYVGIACALKNSGVGVGLPDTGRCRLTVENGKIIAKSAASCIGQGIATVITQIIGETLDIHMNDIVVIPPDSLLTPPSGPTSGSRQTLLTGEATRQAALRLKEALDEGNTLVDLEGKSFDGEFLGKTDPLMSDKPHPKNHVAYGYATHLVILNEDGTIKKVVAAHDVGKAVNPINIEGQIEGGVVMSLGYVLTESYILEKGRLKSKYGTLGLLRSTDINFPIEPIIIEKGTLPYSYGAKGIGEICSIPTVAAITLAYRSLDGELRTELPISNTPYSKKK